MPAVPANVDIGVAVNPGVIGGGGGDAITSGSNDSNVYPFSRSGPSSQNAPKKQRVKVSYLSRPLSTNEKTNLDKLLLNMMAIDCQPFSIVDDEGFKSFVYGLNPNYELPDRKTLSTTLLAREYEERLATIKSVVSTECSSMCIAVDSWTSRTMQPYIAITGHFINKTTLDFKSILLQCSLLDGTHTGENIAQAISSAICEWNLTDKINFFVTDNAPNMLSAANILGYSHYGCFAHTINLIAKNALALPDVDSAIVKIKKIVAHFKRSSQAKEQLLRYQINSQGIAEGSALTLIMSVPTRWISTFLMLQRFVHLQESIKATVPNLNVDLPVIPLQEWKCLEQICEVLKPLYEATLIMSGDNYLTASKAMVITQGLLNMHAQMASNNTFYEPVQKLAKDIDVGLKQRLSNINYNLHITVCTFLDPRFKQFAFDNETLRITKTYIIKEICNIIGEDQPSTIPESCAPELSLWNVIDQKISASQPPRSTHTKVSEEVDMYLKQVVINSESCPLEWWRGHKIIYPSLFLIFVKYFNIIVTSVPCGRAFSKAGHLINDRRTRLTSSKVAKLMFLHGNKTF
ncbi:E3 SUMO-protein ligase ZBED1-like [Melitaea cinxia]|uniref:E3 SUMO-protein ligase ZBED1-like n=1 Tax=Melitaea cinxia TaxID=113334 RepID=UPI001E272C21|nr:E3 SUMO-protein ligase ZBED1-like [Melitaea cinxia]